MSLQGAIDKCKKVANLFDGAKLLERIYNNVQVQLKMETLNIEQLEEKHVIGSGKEITRYYSKVSQEKFNKPNTPIILRDTGEFYNSIRIHTDNGNAKIVGETIKETYNGPIDISGYVGGNPLGLTDESYKELREFIKPILAEEIRKEIRA